MTARERFDHHLAEMKKAAIEINPLVRFSQTIEQLDDPDRPLAVCILGQWATGQYEGDGLYGGGRFPDDLYNVKLLDTKAGGEREFSVIAIGEKDRRKWMRQSETTFEAFIGKKVAA